MSEQFQESVEEKPIRVLVIDCYPEGLTFASKLIKDTHCQCDYSPVVSSNPAAKKVLDDDEAVTSVEARSKAELGMCIKSSFDPHGYDIIFLHASNDYSRDYFRKVLKDYCVVIFSGHPPSSWAADENLPDKNCRLVHREYELKPFAEDFVGEFVRGCRPPWECFSGRSLEAQKNESGFVKTLKERCT